ncbi:MAG TPA: PAS domain S-box protein [Anaerolineales bacterium]|nr:PAS domain S-box protein [Anaerolineales bacterium]
MPAIHDALRREHEELIESRQRMQATYERAPIGLVECSLEGKYISVNKEFCRITGYEKVELLKLSIKELIHREDYSNEMKLYRQLVTGDIPFYRIDRRYVRKDGGITWVEITRSLVRNAEGKPLYTVGVVLDISDRKRAEKKLRQSEIQLFQSEATLRGFYESAPILMGVTEIVGDDDILHIYDNPATCRFFGVEQDATSGRLSTELGAPAPAIRQWIRNYRESERLGAPVHFEYLHQDSSRARWLAVTVAVISPGLSQHTRFCYVAEDITESKRAQDELRESQQRLLATYEHTPIGLVECSLEGKYVNVNEEFCRISGYEKEELLERGIRDLSYEEDYSLDITLHQQLVEGKIPSYQIEKRYVRKDGGIVWTELTRNVVRDAQGKTLYTIGAVLDVTERKKAELEIQNLSRFPAENPNPVMRLTPDGKILHANGASASLLEFWNCRSGQSIPDQWQKHVAETFASDVKKEIEIAYDGKVLTCTLAPITEAGYVNLYGNDITERKRAEQALAKFARQQEALFSLADRLHRMDSLEDAFNAALDAILSALECDRSSILLLNDMGVMRFVAWRGLSDEYRKVTEGHSLWKPDEKNAEPVYLNDIHTAQLSDPLKAAIQREGIGSLAFIPLVSNRKLVGKFMVYFDGPHVFSEDEVELSLTIARQLAFGIDRKRAEEKLRESEGRFRVLADSAPIMIWVNGVDAGCEFVNKEYLKFFGKQLEEVQGFGWKPSLHPDDREDYVNAYLEAFNARDPFRAQTRALNDVGEYRWLDSYGVPRYGATGEFLGYIGTSHDITERKQAEKRLRESEERFRILANTMPSIVWTAAPDGTIVYANDQWYEYTGISPEENAKNWPVILHPDDYERCVREWMHALQTVPDEYLIEVRNRRYDGEYRWFQTRAVPSRDSKGNVTAWYGVTTDIHARKESENALRASEEKIRRLNGKLQAQLDEMNSLLEILPTGVWIGNHDCSEVTGNPAAYRMLGLPPGINVAITNPEIREATILRLFVEGVEVAPEDAPMQRVARTGKPLHNFEHELHFPDGRWKSIHANVVPLFDHHGTVRKVIATYTDFTERKQSENRLALLAEISELIRTAEDPQELMFAVSKAVGEHLGVSRCLFNETDPENDRETVYQDYHNGVPSVAGVHKISDYSSITSAEMKAGKTVVNVDSKSDARTAQDYERTYEPNSERAYIAVPLMRENRWVATFWASDDAPRAWSREEVSLLETIAERTWTAIERLRISEALRASEALYRTIAHSIPGGGVYVLNKDFRYLVAEGAVTEAFGLSRQMLEGHTVMEVFPTEPARRMEERLRRNFAGETVSFETKHNGRVYWTQQAPMLESTGHVIVVTLDITERKQAEEALRQSEERFAQFMKHLPGPAWIKDLEGRYVYANDAAEKAFSTRRENLYGKTDEVIFPPETAAQFKKNDEWALAEGKGVQVIETLEQDDGILHSSLVSKFPIPGPDGSPALLGGTAFDLTERLRAEAALRESEGRYRSLFDLIPIAVYTCDASGLIHEFNHRAAELWGREPEKHNVEEKYCGSYRIYHPDGRLMPHEECPMARTLAGQTLEPHELEIMIERPDGVRRNVIAHPLLVRNERGEIIEAINCLYDITERKQMEEALRESEERFRAIVSQATTGIVRKDVAGRLLFVNQAFCDMLGYSESELVGRTIWELTHEEDIEENKRLYDRLLVEGTPFRLEKRLIRRDGSTLWVNVSVSPIMDAAGRPQSAVSVSVDISRRKQAEEELRRSEERERVRAAQLEAIMEAVPAVIWIAQDPECRVISGNRLSYEILRLPVNANPSLSAPEDIRPTNFEVLYDGRVLQPEELPVQRAARGEEVRNFEEEVRFDDGTSIFLLGNATPLYDARNNLSGAVAAFVDITQRKRAEGALRDLNTQLENRVQKRTATIQTINQSLREEITERKKVEEALRESEATARMILDTSPDAVVITDEAGRIVRVNAQIESLFGYQPGEVLGKPVETLIPERFRERHMQHQLTYEEKRYRRSMGLGMELFGRRKDNSEFPVDVMLTPISTIKGWDVMITVRDSTERKRMEQALRESYGRLQVLSRRLVEVQEEERRVLARELHDRVGQTLAALNINLIIMSGQLPEEALQRLGSRLDDSMQLVSDAITLVRNVMTDLRPAILDDYGLEAALQSYIDEYRHRYGIKVAFDHAPQPIPRLGPSREMTLLRIAQEALTNVARHAQADQVSVSLRLDDNDTVRLTVQDNGVGIEALEGTRHPDSHGLKIMRERAEAFGGTVVIETAPGQGTKIDTKIPIENGAQKELREVK